MGRLHQVFVWSPVQAQNRVGLLSLGDYSQLEIVPAKTPPLKHAKAISPCHVGHNLCMSFWFSSQEVLPGAGGAIGEGRGGNGFSWACQQSPWNEHLKSSQGILTTKGATVCKGPSTPTTFSGVAKALLEIGPILQSHPPLPTVI